LFARTYVPKQNKSVSYINTFQWGRPHCFTTFISLSFNMSKIAISFTILSSSFYYLISQCFVNMKKYIWNVLIVSGLILIILVCISALYIIFFIKKDPLVII